MVLHFTHPEISRTPETTHHSNGASKVDNILLHRLSHHRQRSLPAMWVGGRINENSPNWGYVTSIDLLTEQYMESYLCWAGRVPDVYGEDTFGDTAEDAADAEHVHSVRLDSSPSAPTRAKNKPNRL